MRYDCVDTQTRSVLRGQDPVVVAARRRAPNARVARASDSLLHLRPPVAGHLNCQLAAGHTGHLRLPRRRRSLARRELDKDGGLAARVGRRRELRATADGALSPDAARRGLVSRAAARCEAQCALSITVQYITKLIVRGFPISCIRAAEAALQR